MGELQDYSGEFNADLTLLDFSKEAILRLLVATGKLYLGIDGIWTGLMRQKLGDKQAFDFDKEVWFSKGIEIDIKQTCDALNITGNGLSALFKYLQFGPAFSVIYVGPPPDFEPRVQFEMKDKNHGIMTVTRCNSLEYFERHNDNALQKLACEEIDLPAFKWIAKRFNTKIECEPIKLPPRRSPDDVACRWEFKIEE
jgi:hypothetical protein